MMDYKRDTLNAYQDSARAAEYKRYHTKNWSWGRLVTCFEQRALARELSRYNWTPGDRLLDLPCGTGILGKVLWKFPFQVVASDISEEMMALARMEYRTDQLEDSISSDITDTQFPHQSFACVVTLGFLHRVPWEIKRATLKELARLTNRVAIISCSVDKPIQRLKHAILLRLKKNHIPAPCAVPIEKIRSECESHGFRVVRDFSVVPLLSSHTILVLEK